MERGVLATRLLQTLHTGAFLRLNRHTLLPPSLSGFSSFFFFFFPPELILHISSSEVFHSSRFLLAATLSTRTIFSYNFRCTVSPQHRLWASRTVISPELHTSQKSVLLFYPAYAQNPSSAPHRKSSSATEPSKSSGVFAYIS